MHWTKVTCGFNNDEETANFGTRACAVSDEAVYETNTIASIEPDQKTSTFPVVNAAAYQQNLCLTIDSSLIIFNEDCSTYNPVINLESKVESFCISHCGSLVLVGVSGQLKCFRKSSEGYIEIFSRSVSSTTGKIVTLDLYYRGDSIVHIIVVFSNGKIFKSREVNFTKLIEVSTSDADQLPNDIAFESIVDLKAQVVTGILVRSRALIILATCNSVFSVEIDNCTYSHIDLTEDVKIKKIEAIPNGSTLLTLLDDGSLVSLCLHTLVPYEFQTNISVQDFVLFGESTMNECFGNVLLLVNNNHRHLGQTLMFTSYPDFNVEYQIQVADMCYLPKQIGMEDVVFIEGFGEGVGLIDTLRIKSIFQSEPEQRLERMLRKYKFDEAEKFAKSFNLDLDIVYKAHVQRLDQILFPWTDDVKAIKESFNKILELIQKIKDDHFVADVCTTVMPPDFYSLCTMLNYGKERFSNVAGKVDGSLSELLAKVSSFSRRLDTCMLIYGSSATVTHWTNFPKPDLITNCLNHIQRNEMKEANLIWGRHCDELKLVLSIQKARQILNTIPKSVKIPDLIQWLERFVPTTLSHFEDFVVEVAQWAIQRARDLEIVNGQTWLDSGTLLLKRVVQLLHTPLTEKNVLVQSMRMSQSNDNLSYDSPIKILLKEIDTLQEIKNLKRTYAINITYDQFVEEDHKSFVIVLLDNVALENVSLFMDECFPRLMRERHLEPDSQILQFVQEVVMNCENYVFLDEAPWEGRVSALIPHIESDEIKLNTILVVLRAAPVPWTAIVSDLAQLGSQLPHAKANDVKTEINNVPKRLLMKKYGRPSYSNRKNELLIVRIILMRNLESMLDDVEEFVKCLKGDPTDVYVCVLTHLIEKNEDDKVWTVLKSLKSDLKIECITRLLYYMRVLLSFGDWKKMAKYFQFTSEFEKLEDKTLFYQLKKVHSMQEEYDITTSIALSGCEKNNILNSYAEEASNGILSGNLTVNGGLKRIKRLCYLLDLSLEEGIITLAILCSRNLEISLTISSEIEDFEEKSLRVYNGVSVLIGHLMSTYEPSQSTSNLINLFNTVTKQLSNRFMTYSSSYGAGCVTRWLSLLHRNSSRRILKTVYEDPAPTPATAILLHSSVYNMIHNYASISKNNNIPLEVSMQSMVTINPEVKVEANDMMAIWQKLREEQQNLACIRLIFEFCWSQKILIPDAQEITKISKVIPQFITDLLKKLFRLPKFDVELSLALLHFFDKTEAIKFLVTEASSVGFNLQRLSAISQLGLAFCYLNKMDKYLAYFKKHHISCKWAKRLLEFGLQYKDAFKTTPKEHQQLITKLIALPSANTAMLKEFCNDYSFDLQECLMIFLEHSVLSWEPDFHITQDASGNTVMTVHKGGSELLRHCEAILNEILQPSQTHQWPHSVQNTIIQLWNKVNFYYYEVHSVLCTLMLKIISPQGHEIEKINSYKRVLNFFQMYTRISSPEKTEQEQWFNSFPNTNNLPLISNYRLPFTRFFSKDLWNLIKPELSLKTYKIWYNFVAQLGLERDMVCVLTIQRLTSDQLAGGSRDKSSWRLQRCNTGVLREIQDCVGMIDNPEMAGASLYYVVNHMPPGADQVEAATLCFRQAEHWMTRDSESARNAFAKVQKKYLTVSTSHILHRCGLGRPEYLHLVLQPQELISALYDDPSILDPLTTYPDINGAATAVGQLHKVNVMGIRHELLNEWLNYSDSLPFDTSTDDMTVNIAAIRNPLQMPDNDSILRACYVLQSLGEETAALYLASRAGLVTGDTECGSMSLRLRALQCLCSITSPEVVFRTTKQCVSHIKKIIQTLLFVSDLERLGMIWSVSGFEACNKEDVMRSLLAKGNPNGVQLAAALGTVYSIIDTPLWDSILKLLTSYSMVTELMLLLPEMTNRSHLLDNSIFIKAWNCALITPFLKAEWPLSEQDHVGLEQALQLLYCCPVPSQLDLSTVLAQCERLQCPEITSRIRPFLLLTALGSQNS